MSDQSDSTTSTLVKTLGVASFGLGLSELAAPAKVAGIAGVDLYTALRTNGNGARHAA